MFIINGYFLTNNLIVLNSLHTINSKDYIIFFVSIHFLLGNVLLIFILHGKCEYYKTNFNYKGKLFLI